MGPPTLEQVRGLRDEIAAIARRHGVLSIRLFGSVARGEAQADSDVDFLVDLEPGRTVLDLSGLIVDLEDALGRPVNVIEGRTAARIRARLEREALPL